MIPKHNYFKNRRNRETIWDCHGVVG